MFRLPVVRWHSPLTLCLLLSPLAAQTQPAAPHDARLAVAWMQRSAEYQACCLQAFRSAAWALEMAVDDLNWSACLEQDDRDRAAVLPPAVIVDVDETILDNTAYNARLIADGTRFASDTWAKWVHEQQAAAVPGALGYVQAARRLGVRIVYVTNRSADGKDSTQETDTRANLQKLGFPIVEADGEDMVLSKGEIGDKSARRRKVAERFRIVQLIGDNLADFAPGTEPRRPDATPHGPAVECAQVDRDRDRLVNAMASWWGERWILIPNPAYGSFEDVLRGGQGPDQPLPLRLQR
jgi:5'-nucleotidase (lipoprotein e(P4) family)